MHFMKMRVFFNYIWSFCGKQNRVNVITRAKISICWIHILRRSYTIIQEKNIYTEMRKKKTRSASLSMLSKMVILSFDAEKFIRVRSTYNMNRKVISLRTFAHQSCMRNWRIRIISRLTVSFLRSFFFDNEYILRIYTK